MAGESRPNQYYIWCLLVIYKKANSELFLKTLAGILSIWFPCKILWQDSHKIYNDFSTLSLQFVPYFSKFIIIFQLVLRCIYRAALETVRKKVYISQLLGLQYKKEISLTSTGHAGNLPYANKTNKINKQLTYWFCLKIAMLCFLLNKKMFQRGEVTSSSQTLQIYKPF